MAAPATASPPTMRAESWAQLTQLLYEDSWAESLGLYRSRFAFRGEPSTEEPLRTSLQRLGPSAPDVEHHLLRNFRKFASPSSAPGRSWWDWLAVAQHHGLPTRLLDWTFSPYVALHFATDPVAADGAVWCVDFRRLHEDAPRSMTRLLAREKADLFTTEMLSSAASRLEELPGGRRRPYAVFFDPPSMDARLTNQFSVFSFLSDPGADMLSVLRRRRGSARRIVIPSALKSEVRDKLDQANITERVLFPGLDGLARWLSRYYAPRIQTNGALARRRRRRTSGLTPVIPRSGLRAQRGGATRDPLR
jgi:hypothetical protein